MKIHIRVGNLWEYNSAHAMAPSEHSFYDIYNIYACEL